MTHNDAQHKKTVSTHKPRSDRGKPQLTPRDCAMLQMIGEQIAYRFDQLQGLLARHPLTQSADPTFLSETRTFVIIRRWQQLGLVEYRKILHDQLSWVWLTAKGIAQFQLPVRFHEPFHGDLEHLFWVNETRALVEDQYGSAPGFCWESERLIRATRDYLLAQHKKEQDADIWLPWEYQCQHRPDGLFRHQRGEGEEKREWITAIEVELSHKAYSTWKTIFLELLDHYHEVHYYVHASVKPSLAKALERFQNETPAYGEPDAQRRRWITLYDLEERL